MDKLAISMRKTDKAIKSMLATQKRTRRSMSATDKKIKAMIAARPRANKKFEQLIALLEKDSNSHRKRR